MRRVKYSRRPIEYVLYVILFCIVILAFWVAWQLNITNEQIQSTVAPKELSTTEQIGAIVESGVIAEEDIFESADKGYESLSKELEAAVNNVGNVYDETTY